MAIQIIIVETFHFRNVSTITLTWLKILFLKHVFTIHVFKKVKCTNVTSTNMQSPKDSQCDRQGRGYTKFRLS